MHPLYRNDPPKSAERNEALRRRPPKELVAGAATPVPGTMDHVCGRLPVPDEQTDPQEGSKDLLRSLSWEAAELGSSDPTLSLPFRDTTRPFHTPIRPASRGQKAPRVMLHGAPAALLALADGNY